ncbi:MAG TPA: ribose-5-phosphate isomerase RpiA [Anaerolineae bacterium]
MKDLDQLKRLAAKTAVESIESGMVIGLGTGSTATYAIQAIGRRLRDDQLRNVIAISSSEASADKAESWNIPLTTLDDHPIIDITIDGADEVDPSLDLIKGLGGALLREKIVAVASREVIIVGDYTKRVERLGTRAPVPVEVIPFARRPVQDYLESLGARVELRIQANQPFVTDEGNYILDCYFGLIDNPTRLAQAIRVRPGVVEHGLFLGIATQIIVATPTGIKRFRRA